MPNRYLLLWLEAPLQSWGHDSRFGTRQTLDFPTRSGLLGMICCARGDANPSSDWLARWCGLAMPIMAYARANTQGPASRPPLSRDFQVVGNGYNDEDPWQALMSPKTVDGKNAVGGGSKLTYRYYLQDSAFAVVMEVPGEMEEDISQHLQSPVWPIFLGRKSCTPTDFVFRGVYDTEGLALAEAAAIAAEKRLVATHRIEDGKLDGASHLVVNDVPISLGSAKCYRDRVVSVFQLS